MYVWIRKLRFRCTTEDVISWLNANCLSFITQDALSTICRLTDTSVSHNPSLIEHSYPTTSILTRLEALVLVDNPGAGAQQKMLFHQCRPLSMLFSLRWNRFLRTILFICFVNQYNHPIYFCATTLFNSHRLQVAHIKGIYLYLLSLDSARLVLAIITSPLMILVQLLHLVGRLKRTHAYPAWYNLKTCTPTSQSTMRRVLRGRLVLRAGGKILSTIYAGVPSAGSDRIRNRLDLAILSTFFIHECSNLTYVMLFICWKRFLGQIE